MPEVNMPRLSDTMQEGMITSWLKKVGDTIKKGEVVAEVETDKANMEIEAYSSGVLEQILVQEGETAPIGKAIAIIGGGAEVPPPVKPVSSNQTASAVQTAQFAGSVSSAPPVQAAGVWASCGSNGTGLKVSPPRRR